MDIIIIIAYVLGFLAVMFAFGWLKYKIRSAILRREFLNTFRSNQQLTPKLEIGTSYSWPTFKITFTNQADFELASNSGLIETYKNKLKDRYGSDFDPELAVFITY
ncbi:hypothetical protein [Reichenbachiella sp.]